MWTRSVSPSAFGLALVCFLLPWIEIRCDSPRGGVFSGQGSDVVIVSQSGLQMTYGGISTTVNGQPPSAAQDAQLKRQKGNRNLAAPAMIVYALCLLAGLGASLTFRDQQRRFLAASAASSIAIVVLVVQLANGFPLVEHVPRRQGGNGWSYTIAFWVGLSSTFGALLAAVWHRFSNQFPAEATTAEKDLAAKEPNAPLPRGADDVMLEWLAKVESYRAVIMRGAMILAVSSILVLFALFVWPGFLRPLPQTGIAMSGFVDYMISDEHIAAVKLGMTLEEVATALDIAQERMEVPTYIRDKEKWRQEQKQIGDSNVQLIPFSRQRLGQQKEFWFNFSASSRTLSVRIRDGKVVEIKDSKEGASW